MKTLGLKKMNIKDYLEEVLPFQNCFFIFVINILSSARIFLRSIQFQLWEQKEGCSHLNFISHSYCKVLINLLLIQESSF